MKSVSRLYHRALVIAAACAALAVLSTANAKAENPVQEFNIPSGDLGEALRAFGAVSNTQILFAPEVVTGRRSEGVRGHFSVEAAMSALLANTSLTYRVTASNVILVTLAAEPEPAPVKPVRPGAAAEPALQEYETLEAVVVTANKRLENIQDVPSSVLVVTQESIERSNIRDFDDLV
ncbi:MAG TPA: secretin and TonB N-terminal domain-containing protein, partial [Steroidobacteraceae bacterium]|nr:secretin and TonB N-terminal domain-containing protein [Steroidobacteraceae bacterium]